MQENLQFFSEEEAEQIRINQFKNKLKQLVNKCTDDKREATRVTHTLLRYGYTSFAQIRDANIDSFTNIYGIGPSALSVLTSMQNLLKVSCHTYL